MVGKTELSAKMLQRGGCVGKTERRRKMSDENRSIREKVAEKEKDMCVLGRWSGGTKKCDEGKNGHVCLG